MNNETVTAPSAPGMKRPTVPEFKRWCLAHGRLAEAVCLATAFAQAERARVDAYIAPIFDSFGFVDEDGKKIERAQDIYLSTDEEKCKAFFAAADAAHRAHGFTGKLGYCPALLAESAQCDAEWHLIKAGGELFGIDMRHAAGKLRADLLEHLLKSCLAGRTR